MFGSLGTVIADESAKPYNLLLIVFEFEQLPTGAK